jgi:hypothetical protein
MIDDKAQQASGTKQYAHTHTHTHNINPLIHYTVAILMMVAKVGLKRSVNEISSRNKIVFVDVP